MNRTEKATEVAQLTERFSHAKATLFAEYRGLTVAQMTALRAKVRGVRGVLQVVKNRLAKRALQAAQIAGVDHYCVGPTAVAASEGDAAALAKALVIFAKENAQLKLKGGYVEGRVIPLEVIKALAALPSREVVFAQLMGVLKAPIGQLANVLQGVSRKLVVAVKAIEQQK